MEIKENIDIENSFLTNQNIKYKKQKNKIGLWNIINIFILCLIPLIIGIITIFINKSSSIIGILEKASLQKTTTIFSVLLIISGFSISTLTYFILVYIIINNIFKYDITINYISTILFGSGSVLSLFQNIFYGWNINITHNKIITILCLIISSIIIVLHTFQTLLFGSEINIKLTKNIDNGYIPIPYYDYNNNSSNISPSGANEILALGQSLFDTSMDINSYQYNNLIYYCQDIPAMPNTIDIINKTEYITAGYKICLNSRPINITVDFNCKKYNECVIINGTENNIAGYKNTTYVISGELKRDNNYTWSGYIFSITNNLRMNNCTYSKNDICVIGGGINNNLLLLESNTLYIPLLNIITYNNDLLDYNKINTKPILDVLDGIKPREEALNLSSQFNGAAIIYDLIIKSLEGNVSDSDFNKISIYTTKIIDNNLIFIAQISAFTYLAMSQKLFLTANVDSYIFKLNIEYKYKIVILILGILWFFSIIIIVIILISKQDAYMKKPWDKNSILKILLGTNNKYLSMKIKNNNDKNNLKIKLKNEDGNYIWITDDIEK